MKTFWSKVDKSGACWVWTGCRDRHGYGQFKPPAPVKKLIGAHRMSWMIANSEVPAGLHVCHRCDNRACVNPAHLFVGTNADNVRDRQQKGRTKSVRGEEHPGAKIGAVEVVAIREMVKQGAPQSEVSARFGIGNTQVGRIARRAEWRHV